MNFQPLNDMILVKPDPLDEKIGSIHVPQGVLTGGDKPGDYHEGFIGTVVAIGPGDRHVPVTSLYCRVCHKKRIYAATMHAFLCECDTEHDTEQIREFNEGPIFPCEAVAWDAGRYLMLTKVGDRVIYPRRASMPGGEFSVLIDGERYQMFHEEQCALAVVSGI